MREIKREVRKLLYSLKVRKQCITKCAVEGETYSTICVYWKRNDLFLLMTSPSALRN